MDGFSPIAVLVRGIAVDVRGSKAPVSFERIIPTATETPDNRDLSAAVYPNPIRVGSEARVLLDLPSSSQQVEVFVYDALGRVIFTASYAAGMKTAVLPGESFSVPGLYFIRIVTQKKASTIPIIAAR
jgi:hypothetical protein